MEIILLEDVKKLGKKGELIKVNDGYARNYVLPKKLGIEANNQNKNDLKLKNAHDEKMAKELLNEAKNTGKIIDDGKVTVKIKAGQSGRSFGSVSNKDIAEELKNQLNVQVDKKKIVIETPIKAIGTFTVKVKLHKEVTAKLTVQVIEA